MAFSALMLTSCDPGGDAQSISISKSEMFVKVGEKVKVDYFTYPALTMNNSVSWYSDNTNVCTVTRGYVKGVGTGSTTVHATCKSGKTASIKVTVQSQP